jgi:phosphoglucomutase
MDIKMRETATEWGNNKYFHEADRMEILELLADPAKNETEITDRFYRNLEFGTGGLRAPMGMGQNRMNRYNVRRATQAMANNIIKYFNGASAVISYDSRNHSQEFAMEAAGVFAANGIKAYVFKQLTPTPVLSFAIRYLKAQCGIMITASHNPPIYNGLKAYWNDGAQVVAPIDNEIIHEYNALTDWDKIKFMSFEEAYDKGLASWVDEEINNDFFKMISREVIQDREMCINNGHKLSIVYTALHGSAEVPCNVAAKKLGFSVFHSIKEQASPDGNFPTVKSPNPEDPKALKMAIDYMLQNNADIVFGTDPDGDRLGVVINHHGKEAIINGNQIATIMLYYLFSTKANKKILPENPLVIKSIVTSPIQNVIVEYFNGTVIDTLTGFKWMAALIQNLEDKKSDYNFIFASEESFGYMPHKESRDKDGVSSMALMSEAALYYKLKGMTLIDALDEIYIQFGFFYESLVSKEFEGIEGAEKIKRIMHFFRGYTETHFAGEEIIEKEDFQSSLATNVKLKSTTKISLPQSNVLSFTFTSGNKLFLRPSGTEPKIKFYTMVRETHGNLTEKKSNALKRVKIIEDKILEICENI